MTDWPERFRQATDFAAAYAEYLKSPEWAEKRRRVVRDARCFHCRIRPASEAHHRTYERIGDEEFADLVPLCRRCHEFVHERRADGPPATSAGGELFDGLAGGLARLLELAAERPMPPPSTPEELERLAAILGGRDPDAEGGAAA